MHGLPTIYNTDHHRIRSSIRVSIISRGHFVDFYIVKQISKKLSLSSRLVQRFSMQAPTTRDEDTGHLLDENGHKMDIEGI